MFRRTKPDSARSAATSASPKPGGKGRPTPSRREAEAAARARSKGSADRKEAARLLRQKRAEQNAKMREGMKTGEERFLPARDQGKVRRFARDLVDSRLSMAEFLLPMLVIIMVMTYSGSSALGRIGQSLWLVTILLVSLDTVLLVFRLKRELKRRFPGEPTKGLAFYTVLRAMQLRFLRLPKPKVRLAQRLPEHY